MNLDLGNAWDSIKDGTKEVTEVAHAKTSEFHESYVSKVLPDCGKYGDEAKFAAEMVPGVSEYNAIVDGDWTAFAIAAGIDIGAIAIGAFTAGAGYAAVKGGSTVAKTGAKVAAKEVAEAGVKKVVKEVAGEGAEKLAKEAAEAGTKKVVKETAEGGAKKVVKEVAEDGTKKLAKEVTEEGTKKVTKEVGEKMSKELVPEYLHEVESITKREIKPAQMEKLQKALKEQDFVKLDPDKVKLHRKLFDNAKDKLIDEWEKNTGDKWPVYAKDILNDAGEVIRTAGQRFDAHHLIESSFGGPNAWWNLHPAAFPSEHQAGIHAINSLANKIF
jgi:hypothetical protein